MGEIKEKTNNSGTDYGTEMGQDDTDPVIPVVARVLQEYNRAIKLHGTFASAHEGYAVILEELDELWEEVKTKEPDPERMAKEAVQVGAMAMRFLVDVALPAEGNV